MKINLYPLFLAVSLATGLFTSAWGQDDRPTAAPSLQTFALNPNQLGAAASSVNLFTGDVALPLNLLSLPGHNGLDINVAISYSSNVQHVVNTWNQEAPTGILGLGWNMDMPKIVCDHKQTGTREDDEFYLQEGGAANRLIQISTGTDAGGTYATYQTKNYQFWKIKFYVDLREDAENLFFPDGPNKWEIIKEDGTRYVYGDKNSGRSTIQWVVRWGNWIGNSAEVLNQSRMAYIWNLSEVVNTWGEKITFEYENVEQYVGSTAGKQHTEASYLKRVTDVFGRTVVFQYKDKLNGPQDVNEPEKYYQEPHTEQEAEPDAYQEVYEKKMLDYIDVFSETNRKLFSVHFSYSSISPYNGLAKPLLTGIVQKNANGNSLPGLQFEYYLDGPEKGFLKTMTTPTRGTITYAYKKDNNQLGHANRQNTSPIQAPAGYAEPKVWIAGDYVVIAWRELNPDGAHSSGPKRVSLWAYRWVGEWKEQFLTTLHNIELFTGTNNIGYTVEDYKDFQVALQPDFFAVLVNKFNADKNYQNLYVYYKDMDTPAAWRQYSESTVLANSGKTTLLSGNHFVAVGYEANNPPRTYTHVGNTWSLHVLDLPAGQYFHTAANNYILSHDEESHPDNIYFSYLTVDRKWTTKPMGQEVLFGSAARNSHWHASNSFALGMVSDNSEFFYRWDVTYSNFYRDDVLGRLKDEAPVSILNNSLVGIYGNVARFDGYQWHVARVATYNNFDASREFSYGDDYVIRPLYNLTNGFNGGRVTFNPNLLGWGSDEPLDTYGSTNRFNRAGIDHYFFGRDCYYRNTHGDWYKIFTLSGTPDRTTWYQGYPRLQAHSPSGYNTEVFVVKNGTIQGVKLLNGSVLNQEYPAQGNNYELRYFPRSILAGNQTIVSIPTSSSNLTSNITAFQLNRLVGDELTGQQVDYPVVTITVNDGTKSTYTAFQYNFATATADPSGMVAQYHEVKVVPGSSDASSTPNGYTVTYFHNGLKRTESEPELPSDPLLVRMGAPYATRVYDAGGKEVSSTETVYGYFSKVLKNNDDKQIELATYARPTQTITRVNGVQTISSQAYSEATGLVERSISSVNYPRISNVVEVHYKYFWQQYDPNREKNILTPVIQTKKIVIKSTPAPSTKVVGMSATTWKEWNGVYAPHKSYQWLRSGSDADFDFAAAAGASEPASVDWQKVSEIDKLDAKGNVLQVTSF